MSAHVKSPVRKVAAFGLSLMLATALCPLSAIAADDDVELVEPAATEELVEPEAEDVELEAASAAEEAGEEEEAVEEGVAEEVSEEEVSEEGVSEEEPVLQPAATTGDLNFAYAEDWDGNQYARVTVYDVQSGTVTYDEATRTLTLDNATIGGSIETCLDLTINLVGESTCSGISDNYDDNYGSYGDYTIVGSGSLRAGSTYCFGGVTVTDVQAGTVTFDAATSTLTLDNATIDGYIYVYNDITIDLVGQSSCDGISRRYNDATGENGDYTIKGSGSLRAGSTYYFNNMTVSNVQSGTVTFDSATSTLTLDNVTIDDDFDIYDDITLVLNNTTIGDDIYVYGNVTIDLVGQSSCYYIYCRHNDATGKDGKYTIKGSGSLKCYDGTYYAGVKVDCGTSGTVTYDAATSILTLDNATIDDDIDVYGNVTINLVGASICDDIYIDEGATLSIKGTGSLKAYGVNDYSSKGTLRVLSGTLEASNSVYCKKLTISGGTVKGSISASSLTMTKGVVGSIQCDNGAVKISGGTVKGGISAGTLTVSGSASLSYTGTGKNNSSTPISCTSLVMKGGKINVSKCSGAVSASKSISMSGGSITAKNCGGCIRLYSGSSSSSLTMTGGTITATDCDYGISLQGNSSNRVTSNLVIKKGTITVTNPSDEGIYIWTGNLTMTGGTIKITGAYGRAVEVHSGTYRGKTYGGKVSITGGSVTATARNPKSNSAIRADSMTNSVASLKTIAGILPNGARFKVGGNTYQVRYYGVVLTSYGSTKTKAVFKNVSYGKYSYSVRGVAAGAFSTKRGKKVKSLVFANQLDYLGKGAFKNTVSLTSIKFNYLHVDSVSKKNKNGTYTTIYKKSKDANLANGCFAGMGKAKGRGLTVRIGYSKEDNVAWRKFMRKLGLPAGAKFATR